MAATPATFSPPPGPHLGHNRAKSHPRPALSRGSEGAAAGDCGGVLQTAGRADRLIVKSPPAERTQGSWAICRASWVEGIPTHQRAYNHLVGKGGPMGRTLFPIAVAVAFLSSAQGASAFTTQPVNPETMSSRLADPDELADKMSNGQSGGTTLGLPGRPRLQFSAPPSGNGASSPFLTSPGTAFVPSEHR